MESLPKPGSTSVLKRGYTDEEIAQIYEFGRLSLANGNLRTAESIFEGLTHVAPDYSPAWLGLAYVGIYKGNIDGAVFSSRQALRIDPHFTEALLYLAACLMSSGDYNSAGTHLGEVAEQIDSGQVDDPSIHRFYRIQLARFQNR